jgi:hypothetical protein
MTLIEASNVPFGTLGGGKKNGWPQDLNYSQSVWLHGFQHQRYWGGY